MPSTRGSASPPPTRPPPARSPGWNVRRCRPASFVTRISSWLPWMGYAFSWTARLRRRTRSPACGRCSMAHSATQSNSGCFPLTRPTG
jgi:hypothetical protein